jgi:hypothetical protein
MGLVKNKNITTWSHEEEFLATTTIKVYQMDTRTRKPLKFFTRFTTLYNRVRRYARFIYHPNGKLKKFHFFVNYGHKTTFWVTTNYNEMGLMEKYEDSIGNEWHVGWGVKNPYQHRFTLLDMMRLIGNVKEEVHNNLISQKVTDIVEVSTGFDEVNPWDNTTLDSYERFND